MTTKSRLSGNGGRSATDELHLGQLKESAQDLLGALGQRALASVSDKVTGATGRLTDFAEQGGGPGLMAAVTGANKLSEGKSPAKAALSAGLTGLKERVKQAVGKGGKGGKGKKLKVTNIVEEIDVGLSVRDAYNLWTQFADFPSFMKKVESVEQISEEKVGWKAQIFWSHRTWESTIVEQVPDQRIVWRSKGPKGHVDGAVTFHQLAPELTRILVVLEYHPQGLFERTGNLWRAQGRRARLELKHFRRHAMSTAVLNLDKVEGWRGEIRDSQVVKDHQTALDEEREGEHPEDQDHEIQDHEDQDHEIQDHEDQDHEDQDDEVQDQDEDQADEDRPARQKGQRDEEEHDEEYADDDWSAEDEPESDSADDEAESDQEPAKARRQREGAASRGTRRRR